MMPYRQLLHRFVLLQWNLNVKVKWTDNPLTNANTWRGSFDANGPFIQHLSMIQLQQCPLSHDLLPLLSKQAAASETSKKAKNSCVATGKAKTWLMRRSKHILSPFSGQMWDTFSTHLKEVESGSSSRMVVDVKSYKGQSYKWQCCDCYTNYDSCVSQFVTLGWRICFHICNEDN